MANLVQMRVDGLSELSAALKQLPRNVGQNVLRGAVYAGAKVIKDAVYTNAPVYVGDDPRVRAGILKNAVYMKHIDELSSERQQVFFVSLRRGRKEQAKNRDAYYWTWVEFGHHIVPRAPRGGMKLTARRNAVLSGLSLIAGSSYVLPHPFFRPAYEASKDAAAKAIREYLSKRVPLEAEKLRAR